MMHTSDRKNLERRLDDLCQKEAALTGIVQQKEVERQKVHEEIVSIVRTLRAAGVPLEQ